MTEPWAYDRDGDALAGFTVWRLDDLGMGLELVGTVLDEADARLIAQAPRLLAVLEQAEMTLHLAGGQDPVVARTAQLAREVISAARGAP